MMRKIKLAFVVPLVTLSYWIHQIADNVYLLAEHVNDYNVET